MRLLSVLSKNTSTSVPEFIEMPFHLVMAIFNQLKDMAKEEQEAQKRAEKESSNSISLPSFSMPSMPSMPHF